MFSINLFFRGAPLPRKLPRPTAPASKCTKMHSRRVLQRAGGIERSQKTGTFRYHVWTIKQATQPKPKPKPKPQSPKHTDDVVDDVERRCIAPPKMANGQPKTLVPTRKQELHTRKNKTLEIGAIANTLSIH